MVEMKLRESLVGFNSEMVDLKKDRVRDVQRLLVVVQGMRVRWDRLT